MGRDTLSENPLICKLSKRLWLIFPPEEGPARMYLHTGKTEEWSEQQVLDHIKRIWPELVEKWHF